MVAKHATSEARPTEVGDRVRFKFGLTQVTGKIVGYRGLVGKPQDRKYVVEFLRGGNEPLRVELSQKEFVRIS
jgi:hypothetical protein